MGRLESIAVFHSAEPCSENGVPKPMPCCNDVTEELKVEDITNASFDFKFESGYVDFVAVTSVVIDEALFTTEKQQPKFYNYSAPPPDHDLLVMHQVFII